MSTPDLEIKVRLSGQYQCVLNEGTGREVRTPWFDNLVTNIGLDKLATTSVSPFTYGSIGTGTTTPANSDTTLQSFTAQSTSITTDSQSNGGASAYVGQMQIHYTYAQGAVVGNMAEVGCGWGTSGTNLFSRARILDGGGSPTTLTVTSLDQLTVYYKLTVSPVTSDITGSVTISAVSYSYTGRLANAANFWGSPYACLSFASGSYAPAGLYSSGPANTYPSTSTLGAITTTPSGTTTSGGSASSAAYTAGNYYLDNTLTLGPTQGNSAGGIGCVLLNFGPAAAAFQYSFSPVIPKDNTKTLTLVTRFSWSR